MPVSAMPLIEDAFLEPEPMEYAGELKVQKPWELSTGV